MKPYPWAFAAKRRPGARAAAWLSPQMATDCRVGERSKQPAERFGSSLSASRQGSDLGDCAADSMLASGGGRCGSPLESQTAAQTASTTLPTRAYLTRRGDDGRRDR